MDKPLELFVEQIRKKLGSHLRQIVLFGSKARGGDVAGSDYDCLVVVDEVSKRLKDIIDEVTGEVLYEHNAVFSAFIVSEGERAAKPYSPLLLNIGKEGVVL
jgi:predicted nucleotidyltransferase